MIIFHKTKELIIVITPEGTRKYNAHWKKGVYFIAQRANVPLVLVYIDYVKKEGGIGQIMTPSGNFEEDFKIIGFYEGENDIKGTLGGIIIEGDADSKKRRHLRRYTEEYPSLSGRLKIEE